MSIPRQLPAIEGKHNLTTVVYATRLALRPSPFLVPRTTRNRSVDCWALGVLTFEYTAGYTPFQSPGEPTDITALFTRIAGSKVATSKSIFPSNYDEKVRRLIDSRVARGPPKWTPRSGRLLLLL